jgi:hypothetical protein
MTNLLKNEIQRLLDFLKKNSNAKDSFMTMPNALYERHIENLETLSIAKSSNSKTKEEAENDFKIAFALLKEENKGLTNVINLREPMPDGTWHRGESNILVEDCTIENLEYFLFTDDIRKD